MVSEFLRTLFVFQLNEDKLKKIYSLDPLEPKSSKIEKLCRSAIIELKDPNVNSYEYFQEIRKSYKSAEGFSRIFAGCTFDSSAGLNHIAFNGLDLSRATFNKVIFKDIKLDGATLDGARFFDCDFAGHKSSIKSAKLAEFHNCTLTNANWSGSNLEGASIIGGDCRRMNLSSTKLANCVFSPLHADHSTVLEGLNTFIGMRISRTILESLGPEHGGLSIAQIQSIKVRHDLYVLQRSFGGFFGMAHLLALAAWLFPYLWFTAVRLIEASFSSGSSEKSISLLLALCRFAYNGPSEWQSPMKWPALFFYTFLIGAVYNALRAYFLYTTKNHELDEKITGLPSSFKLVGRVLSLWKWHFYIFRIFIISTIVSLVTFILTPVPIDTAPAGSPKTPPAGLPETGPNAGT